tara:strand:- start:428 stop:973 length:546 start_codon:yes stop_codon:yes gene_type:complete
MDNFPDEINDYIFSFIYHEKCYLEDKYPNDVKKCACLNKKFYQNFKCKPFFLSLDNGNYVEFCSIHQRILIENLKRLFRTVYYNYSNQYEFDVKLLINGKEELISLTNLYMEPYIGILDLDYIYHSFYFEEVDNNEIRMINISLNNIFDLLLLKFNTSSYGYNSFTIKKYVNIILEKLENL